ACTFIGGVIVSRWTEPPAESAPDGKRNATVRSLQCAARIIGRVEADVQRAITSFADIQSVVAGAGEMRHRCGAEQLHSIRSGLDYWGNAYVVVRKASTQTITTLRSAGPDGRFSMASDDEYCRYTSPN